MQLRYDALAGQLSRKLAALYVVHGDEALLVMEAADAIRAAARHAGCSEREVFVAEAHFRWDDFVAAGASPGLFSSRRLIDLRIPSGKPGTDGAAALVRYVAKLGPDDVTLITLPRLDRATQSSEWFTALASAGTCVAVPTLERTELPAWIAARIARSRQQAGTETLAFLADRCEGNLVAAHQEIEKLALLLPQGMLDHDDVERVVADVARYDVRDLSEAWLSGDAVRTLRIVAVLRGVAEPVNLALWQLAEDARAILAVHDARRDGMPIAAALRAARAWGRRQAALERATRRVAADAAMSLLRELAGVDALAKGQGVGDPWDALEAAALALAGHPIMLALSGSRPSLAA